MFNCTSCGKPHSSTKRTLCKPCYDAQENQDSTTTSKTGPFTHNHDPRSLGNTYTAFPLGAATHSPNILNNNNMNNTPQQQQFTQQNSHTPLTRAEDGITDWIPNAENSNSDNFWQNMNKLMNVKLNNLKDSILVEVKQITEPIEKDVNELKQENALLKQEFATLKTKTKEALDKMETDTNTNINTSVTKLEERNQKMCQILNNHQQSIDAIEFEKRQCNIIIRGVPENDPPDDGADKAFVEEVMDKIGILHQLQNTKRLGKLHANNKFHRAILLQCTDKEEVDNIIEKAKQLGDLTETDPLKKIYIQRDLPPNIREGNYKLRQQLKAEKAKTENAGVELKLDYRKGTISRIVGEEDEVVIFTSQHPF